MTGDGQCNDPAIGISETIPYTRSKNVATIQELEGRDLSHVECIHECGASLTFRKAVTGCIRSCAIAESRQLTFQSQVGSLVRDKNPQLAVHWEGK